MRDPWSFYIVLALAPTLQFSPIDLVALSIDVACQKLFEIVCKTQYASLIATCSKCYFFLNFYYVG